MEKIGIRVIEIRPGRKEEFDIYPCNCKIGDTIWYNKSENYMHGKVIEINPDNWRISDDNTKELGFVTVKIEDDDAFFNGQEFIISFKNIIYEEPMEDILLKSQELLKSCKIFEAELNEMNKNIEFLLNEYKTNKRYFRQEPGRCTIEDVIKTVFEFAWAASKNYFNSEDDQSMHDL